MIGDTSTGALVVAQRVDRLVLRAAVRLGRLLRRAARRGRSTAAGCSRRAGRIRRSARRYRADTSTLETLLETAGGSVRVIDFMPRVHGSPHRSHRRRVSGQVPLEMTARRRPLRLRRHPPLVRPTREGLALLAGPDALALRPGPAPRATTGRRVVRRLCVRRRRSHPVRAHLVPVARGAAGGSTPSRRWPTRGRGGGSGRHAAPTRAAARRGASRSSRSRR